MAKIHHLCGFHDFVAKVSRWFVFCRCPAKRMSTKVCSTLQGGGVDVGGGGELESGASTVLDQLKKERKQL